MNKEKIFDSYATGYQKKFNENPLGQYQRNLIHKIITPFLENDQHILDIGCGPGSDFEFYKSFNLSVDAIDISSKMVELARSKASDLQLNVNISNTSLENYKTSIKYPLIILNFGVINAFPKLEPVLEKLIGLLKPQGVLIIVSMPPFHFFSIKGLALGFHFITIMTRLFKRKAVLKNGFTIYYYSQKDFIQHFDIVKKINLCALLPTPDQYYRWNWLRLYSKIVIYFDRKVAKVLPDIFGGDHICYIMQSKNSNNR